MNKELFDSLFIFVFMLTITFVIIFLLSFIFVNLDQPIVDITNYSFKFDYCSHQGYIFMNESGDIIGSYDESNNISLTKESTIEMLKECD